MEAITLKALANWSPGLRFATLGKKSLQNILRNPERVAIRRDATLSGLRRIMGRIFTQGFKANPGLELANAFSVMT
jgi:hypothetical protein